MRGVWPMQPCCGPGTAAAATCTAWATASLLIFAGANCDADQLFHGALLSTVNYLLIVISAGIAIYGLLLQLFGVAGWREAVNAIRPNKP